MVQSVRWGGEEVGRGGGGKGRRGDRGDKSYFGVAHTVYYLF